MSTTVRSGGEYDLTRCGRGSDDVSNPAQATGWSGAAERDTMASGKRRSGGAGGNGPAGSAKLMCRKMVVKSDRATRHDLLYALADLPLADREIIEGFVDPAARGPSPVLARAIERWPGAHYWDNTPDGRTLVLVAEDRAAA